MKGSCLCGAIEVTAHDHDKLDVCRCNTCRQWSGGPNLAVHCGSEVNFSGETPARYRSSEWAERGFCPICGTHLFYHSLPKNEYMLSAGLFRRDFEMRSQIFIDQKPSYYEFSNDTVTLTGEEAFAQFSD
ncbi:GFA family protein [Vibrio mimicus]|uniref:GFA family protein n=1 Tax=Vibrio mimicus TaxID=674 RepID=UPI0011DA3DF3|nr:GFA family protein [Vibrio mimicus]TXZ74650.1 GFA family protein [Vibrio mimicus]